MKRNVIRFSHHYPKLHGQKKATLLSVQLENRKKLDPEFVEYDTVYTEFHPAAKGVFEGNNNYPLPNGLVLILTFSGDKHIPFTTVRRAVAKKQDYYERNIGQEFDIVINPEEEKGEEPACQD